MLITIHLAKVRAPTKFPLIPGIFMVATTLAALAWQTYTFANSAIQYLANVPYPFTANHDPSQWVLTNVRPPINVKDYAWLALGINGGFVLVGLILFLIALSMAIRLFQSYRSSMTEARARAPTPAAGGTRWR